MSDNAAPAHRVSIGPHTFTVPMCRWTGCESTPGGGGWCTRHRPPIEAHPHDNPTRGTGRTTSKESHAQ